MSAREPGNHGHSQTPWRLDQRGDSFRILDSAGATVLALSRENMDDAILTYTDLLHIVNCVNDFAKRMETPL